MSARRHSWSTLRVLTSRRPRHFTHAPDDFIAEPMSDTRFGFATVEEAVEEIRQGRMNSSWSTTRNRENEGRPDAGSREDHRRRRFNFMAKFRPRSDLPGADRAALRRIKFAADVADSTPSVHGTAFCEAIDAKVGVTTGISASDRAITILTATRYPKTRPQDLARPGHMFPLRGAQRRRAGARRADGSQRRPGPNCRAESPPV